MIPILVTGGAGYIGSHTAKALSRSGFEPITFDNLSTGHRWAVKWGPLVGGDLADGNLIRDVVGRFKVRAVIHFAASTHVAESMSNPRKYFRNRLDVYGTDYGTPDGTAIRDYVHVSDLATAHVLALSSLLANRQSMALNLGTGRGHSVRQVIQAVESAVGRKVTVREIGRRPGDPPVLRADASEACRILRWQARYSDLETIVGTALRWHAGRVQEPMATKALAAGERFVEAPSQLAA